MSGNICVPCNQSIKVENANYFSLSLSLPHRVTNKVCRAFLKVIGVKAHKNKILNGNRSDFIFFPLNTREKKKSILTLMQTAQNGIS